MGMKSIQFDLGLFMDPTDTMRTRKNLLALMHALVFINISFLKKMADAGHPVPSIYKSGVRYREEDGTEIWQDIPTIIARMQAGDTTGGPDCEDLACWRCAELNFAGIHAKPYIKWRNSGPKMSIMHAVVQWPDGRIEDPSAALGMNGMNLPPPVFIDPGPMT